MPPKIESQNILKKQTESAAEPMVLSSPSTQNKALSPPPLQLSANNSNQEQQQESPASEISTENYLSANGMNGVPNSSPPPNSEEGHSNISDGSLTRTPFQLSIPKEEKTKEELQPFTVQSLQGKSNSSSISKHSSEVDSFKLEDKNSSLSNGKLSNNNGTTSNSEVANYLQLMAQPVVSKGLNNIKTLSTNEVYAENADVKAIKAKEAVLSPPSEGKSKSNDKQVKKVSNKPKPNTNEAQAKSQFNTKLQANLPKKLKEVDEFKQSGKAKQIMSSAKNVIQVDANQITETYGDIKNAPPQEAPPAFTPLGAIESAIPTADMNLGNGMIVPLLPKHSDLTSYKTDADTALEKEGITKTHLEMVNSGELMEVKEGRAEMQQIEEKAPSEINEVHAQSIKKSEQELVNEEQKGRVKMRQTRDKELGNARKEQVKVKSDLEKKRGEVANQINNIYSNAKTQVTAKLSNLNSVALAQFKSGQDAATRTFEDNVDRRIKKFKKDRYGGWFGWSRWLKDLFKGIGSLPEVKQILDSEKATFVNKIDSLVITIANKNKQAIEECRNIVENAKIKIAEYVDGLDPQLKSIGEQAQEDIQGKLDKLHEEINQKEEELAQLLEQKKQEAIQMIDEKIQELKDKMQGILSVIFKFLGELAIKFLKWALNSLGLDADAFINAIKNIGEAIKNIIKDPVSFFKSFIAAIKGGFQEFFGNAASNLFTVLIEWITNGAAGNLVLPTEWTLKNILKMVLDFFGIGWESIKSMFAEHLGPKITEYAVSAGELIQNIIQDGPIAIWNMIKGKASEGWDYAKAKMAEKVGQEHVDKIEMFASLLQKLVTEGPIAMWELIKEKGSEIISAIKSLIIDALVDWGVTKIIKKGVEFLFTIATGFIAAIAAIYRAIMFFINNMDKIGALVSAMLGTLADAAAGNIGAGISKISSAISLILSMLLDLLARLLGIDDIPSAVGNAIEKAVGAVQDFLSKAVKWVADLLKNIWEKIKGWFVGDDKDDGSTESDYDNLPHDEKVKQGLEYLHKVEKTFITEDKITKEDAEKVIDIVKEGTEDKTKRTGKGKIFSKLEITDKDKSGEQTSKWNYLYAASPEEVEGGWWKWIKDEALKAALETAGVDPQMFLNFVGDAEAVISALMENPGQFINNLVNSVSGGFTNYTTNIGDNIKSSLASWITGESGLEIPEDWSVKGVFNLALDALDVEWHDIKGYLINEIGAPAVEVAEQGFSFISTVITEGPIALYNDMQETAAGIKESVIDGIKGWAITEIFEKGALWLMKFITPASGLVAVIQSIWRTIQFFSNEAQRIVGLLSTIGQSITDIAAGNIGGAISFIANGLNTMTTLLISFLAKQLGLGSIRKAIRGLLENIRERIRNAIKYASKKLAGYIKDWGEKNGEDFRTPGEKQNDLDKAIDEADVHVLNKNLDYEETEAKFPAIKKKYNMMGLSLVVDRETEQGKIVYAYGEINPKKKGEEALIEDTNETTKENPYKATKRADGKIEGNFANFVWSGYPNHSVDPHPVNAKYKHKNASKVPRPTGNYVVPLGRGYEGPPSTAKWRTFLTAEKNAKKQELSAANPSWKLGKIDNEAKKFLEQKYGLVWLDLDLRGWQAHHIHPRDWGGRDDIASNWQYLKENSNKQAGEKSSNQHSKFTTWWDTDAKPKLLNSF